MVPAWDPDPGQPLSNMIVRPDPRSDAANAAVKVHPPTLAEPTGPVFDPRYSAANRAWLRR